MATRNPTCEDLVEGELKDRVATLRDLWLAKDHEDIHPEHQTNMYEFGLSFDWVDYQAYAHQPNGEGYFRYQLSWGGPSDEFRFFAQRYGDYHFSVHRIEYWYLDWNDGAMRVLRGEDFELLEAIFEQFFVASGTAGAEQTLAIEELQA